MCLKSRRPLPAGGTDARMLWDTMLYSLSGASDLREGKGVYENSVELAIIVLAEPPWKVQSTECRGCKNSTVLGRDVAVHDCAAVLSTAETCSGWGLSCKTLVLYLIREDARVHPCSILVFVARLLRS